MKIAAKGICRLSRRTEWLSEQQMLHLATYKFVSTKLRAEYCHKNYGVNLRS